MEALRWIVGSSFGEGFCRACEVGVGKERVD